jgi:ABC-type Mn2+/Zn2+ transport system ATPase subunit
VLLDRGITAVVGKNSAGKSTMRKFFFELRDASRNLGQQPMQFADRMRPPKAERAKLA